MRQRFTMVLALSAHEFACTRFRLGVGRLDTRVVQAAVEREEDLGVQRRVQLYSNWLGVSCNQSEKGFRLVQNMQVGPCIPVGIQQLIYML